jgi:hypothetical protein
MTLGINLEQPFASEERQAILEAERSAAAMGVLPDDREKRQAIIGRLRRRLAAAGKGFAFNLPETVVRVDEQGVARIIPKSQAVGWMPGLPASPDTKDVTSRGAQDGRTRPHRERVAFSDPGPIQPVDPRVAASRFHARIRDELVQTGRIPLALQQELAVEGWKLGQPVPLKKVADWCARFQTEFHNRYGGR